jgi:hypothetical protein
MYGKQGILALPFLKNHVMHDTTRPFFRAFTTKIIIESDKKYNMGCWNDSHPIKDKRFLTQDLA